MRDLFIYHPESGTVIPLSDVVYLCESKNLDPFQAIGGTVSEREHKGYRLDNYNMTNLFFGGNE